MSPSFLIIRFSAIGDCVMASYTATAIRLAKPDSRITWAVESRCMAMLNSDKLLTEIVDFPRDRWRKNRWSPRTWRDQIGQFAKLRRQHFDFGIDLQGHSKTAICLRIANPANRIAAFSTDSLARRLNRVAPGDPDGMHRVERMLETARIFGKLAMPPSPIMPSPLDASLLGLNAVGKIATISTGAGALEKQYPSEQWQTVAATLVKQGFHVVWLGAQLDPRIAEPGTVDRVAQWNLRETMSAVAHSTIHLAADTGTGHMAAAFGVPFVSVFGPTDSKLFRPYSDRGEVLRESERPGDVTPAQVLAAVERVLA